MMKKEKNGYNGNYVEEMKTVIRKHLGSLIDLDKRAFLLKNINDVLEDINNSKEDERLKELLNISILRILSLAIYSPENIGHFGLASDCYSHFTSPIRRYADLVVHRIIKMINENRISSTSGKWDRKLDEKMMKEIEEDGKDEMKSNEEMKSNGFHSTISSEEAFSISERCSEQSRNADKFEHTMNDVCTCMDIMFDDDYLRSTHSGIVAGVIPGGVFVDLGGGIEGFIPRKKITRERVYLSDKGTELILEDNIDPYLDRRRRKKNKSKKRKKAKDEKRIVLGIGDRVLVKIKKINIEKGQLEFRMN